MREIYLDNASTTKVDKIVADKVYEVMTRHFGNPSSRHSKGIEAYEIINKSKKAVANLLCCNSQNIVFTSGGTESNNLAILGSINLNSCKNKTIVTSNVEHPSVMKNMKLLESKGFNVNYVKPDKNGNIDPIKIWDLVNENTALVSIMHINNETGNIYDIKNITKGIRFKNKKTIIHCDGVQAFGKHKVNVIDLDIDIYTFSGHKIHAPKGVGGLYIKDNIKLNPLILGGNQEYGIRSGTENVPGIAGIGEACQLIDIEANLSYIKDLHKLLLDEIHKINNIHINSIGNISPYILNFSILNKKSEIILNKLNKSNIFVSNGSACTKGKRSVVLKGMDLQDKYIDSSIRVSFSKYNKKEDIMDLIFAIKEI